MPIQSRSIHEPGFCNLTLGCHPSSANQRQHSVADVTHLIFDTHDSLLVSGWIVPIEALPFLMAIFATPLVGLLAPFLFGAPPNNARNTLIAPFMRGLFRFRGEFIEFYYEGIQTAKTDAKL